MATSTGWFYWAILSAVFAAGVVWYCDGRRRCSGVGDQTVIGELHDGQRGVFVG